MKRPYYVPRESGGHRARPRWTVHNVQTIHTTYIPCGADPRRRTTPVSASWPRPQGEVHICRRCFSPAEREIIELVINRTPEQVLP